MGRRYQVIVVAALSLANGPCSEDGTNATVYVSVSGLVEGAGVLRIVAADDEQDCRSSRDCTVSVKQDSGLVLVTAVPDSGSRLEGLRCEPADSAVLSAAGGECVLGSEADVQWSLCSYTSWTCTATFREISADETQVRVQVDGQGTVRSDPSSLSCASGLCAAVFTKGEQVTLRAVPASGWSFTGWAGDCSGSTAQVSITADRDRFCIAAFVSQTPLPLSVTIQPGSSQPINPGSNVTLTAQTQGGQPGYTYKWEAVDHPELAATLPNAATISFQVPDTMRIIVRVTDSAGNMATAELVVQVSAGPTFEIGLCTNTVSCPSFQGEVNGASGFTPFYVTAPCPGNPSGFCTALQVHPSITRFEWTLRDVLAQSVVLTRRFSDVEAGVDGPLADGWILTACGSQNSCANTIDGWTHVFMSSGSYLIEVVAVDGNGTRSMPASSTIIVSL